MFFTSKIKKIVWSASLQVSLNLILFSHRKTQRCDSSAGSKQELLGIHLEPEIGMHVIPTSGLAIHLEPGTLHPEPSTLLNK